MSCTILPHKNPSEKKNSVGRAGVSPPGWVNLTILNSSPFSFAGKIFQLHIASFDQLPNGVTLGLIDDSCETCRRHPAVTVEFLDNNSNCPDSECAGQMHRAAIARNK